MVARIILYVIVSWLASAHFLRAGNVLLVALCLAAPLLFFYRRQSSLIVLQLAAYAACANWIMTALKLVAERRLEGRSWTAAVLILAAVAALTMVAGLLLHSHTIREKYPR